MPLDQNPHQTDSFWVPRLFNVCVRVFCAPNAPILLVYIRAKIKMSFIWKDDFFFLPKLASSFLSFRRTNMVVYTHEQHREVGLRWTYRRCRFWQKKIIFSHETHFDFGGYGNKQNFAFGVEKSKHPKRVTVWCGFWSIFLWKWVRRGFFSHSPKITIKMCEFLSFDNYFLYT